MMEDTRKFVKFSHSFEDVWAGEDAEEGQVITLSFRFAKPTKLQIQRLQDKASRSPAQAAKNLLLDVIHPGDRQAFMEKLEEYPGIATTFSGAIIKGVGISPELGN